MDGDSSVPLPPILKGSYPLQVSSPQLAWRIRYVGQTVAFLVHRALGEEEPQQRVALQKHRGSGLDLQDMLGSELIWVRVGGFALCGRRQSRGPKGRL